MTKETDSNHNNLNINALPTTISGGDDSGYPEVPVNSYIIRLVSQLLDMADADYTLLSPNDKAALHDLLRFGSLEKMAKLEHKTIPAIRKSVSQAICALKSQILAWQNPHQEILTLTQQVKELEDALQSQGEALSAQKAECEKLERENLELHRHRPSACQQHQKSLPPCPSEQAPAPQPQRRPPLRRHPHLSLSGCRRPSPRHPCPLGGRSTGVLYQEKYN